MKRNFKVALKDFKGNELKDEKGNIQMMSDFVGIKLYALGGNQQASPELKMRAYQLMKRMQQGAEHLELETEDAQLIKDIAKESCIAGIYGQVVETLEG